MWGVEWPCSAVRILQSLYFCFTWGLEWACSVARILQSLYFCFRWGLEWACSVARILQSLYISNEWKMVIHQHLTDCVLSMTDKPDLQSIFALFVMAGFPEVIYIVSETNIELRNSCSCINLCIP